MEATGGKKTDIHASRVEISKESKNKLEKLESIRMKDIEIISNSNNKMLAFELKCLEYNMRQRSCLLSCLFRKTERKIKTLR